MQRLVRRDMLQSFPHFYYFVFLVASLPALSGSFFISWLLLQWLGSGINGELVEELVELLAATCYESHLHRSFSVLPKC